jgi:hypothetical protein
MDTNKRENDFLVLACSTMAQVKETFCLTNNSKWLGYTKKWLGFSFF